MLRLIEQKLHYPKLKLYDHLKSLLLELVHQQKPQAGGSVSDTLVNIVSIQEGDHRGEKIALASGDYGVGGIGVGGSFNITSYTYDGNLNNLSAETFNGKSKIISSSVGLLGASVSISTDKYGGTLIGTSIMVGIGAGLPVNGSARISVAKPYKS